MTTLEEKRICKKCRRRKRVGTEIRPAGRVCFKCQREGKKKYYKRHYRENRDRIVKARAKKLRDSKELREKQEGYRKAWVKRLRDDPVKYADHLKEMRKRRMEKMKDPENRLLENENRRISRRKEWEAKGRVLEPLSMERYRKYNKIPRVEYPIAPLLPFLEQWLVDHTQASLSKESGVPERRIYDYLNTNTTASMISIEKLCHAMNISFNLVYDQSDDLEEILGDGDLCA